MRRRRHVRGLSSTPVRSPQFRERAPPLRSTSPFSYVSAAGPALFYLRWAIGWAIGWMALARALAGDHRGRRLPFAPAIAPPLLAREIPSPPPYDELAGRLSQEPGTVDLALEQKRGRRVFAAGKICSWGCLNRSEIRIPLTQSNSSAAAALTLGSIVTRAGVRKET